MRDIRIHIGQRIVSTAELKGLDSATQLTDYHQLNTYAQEALNFCHLWLQGHQSFVIQTSGSTGSPKPIEIKREQMLASARTTAEALGLSAGDTALLCLNAAYIAGKMMLVRAMETGMDLWVVSPASNPLETVSIAVDFMAMVPLQIQTLLEQSDAGKIQQLNQAKAILIGGGVVSPALETKIRQMLSCPVYSTYGMTETVSHVALRRLNGDKASEYYHTLPGIEIQQDARGCLMVKGAVSQHQWLSTNDRVALHDARCFLWLGRVDNVINSGGVKIQAEMLEQKLMPVMDSLCPGRAFMIAGIPDARLGDKVGLLVEGKSLSKKIQEELLKNFEKLLHPYEKPRQIISLSSFVLTPTGKINRHATLTAALSRNE